MKKQHFGIAIAIGITIGWGACSPSAAGGARGGGAGIINVKVCRLIDTPAVRKRGPHPSADPVGACPKPLPSYGANKTEGKLTLKLKVQNLLAQ